MNLTREALYKIWQTAKEDIESAPADGMLVHLIELQAPDTTMTFTRRDVEVIAMAYLRAVQVYVRP
jgi:hypothetical protein